MRRVQYSALLIVILLLIFAPLGAYAQDNTAQATTNAAPQPLTIFTTYPSQVIGLDETVSLPLKVRSGVAETVNLSVENAPDGWQVSFRGGSRTVSSVFVDGVNDASVDLRVEPANVAPGSVYTFTVVATGATETSRLPVALTVLEKAPPKITLATDLPTLRGKPSTNFTYNVTLKNEGSDDLNVNLTADAPPSFSVNFSLSGQDVTSVPLAAGESKRLSVQAKPFNDIPAGSYPITINAQSNDASASLDLTAEVIGEPNLSLNTPDGRLSGEANAGKVTTFKLVLSNPGTAPTRNVTVNATAPSGWNVTVDPKEIAELAPGQSVDITANVQPGDKSINGDYVVSYSARSDDTSAKNVDMRITVTTSTLWGIAGVGLIALAVGAVALAVGRFGRR